MKLWRARLFRLKCVPSNDMINLCTQMIELFGLNTYEEREVEKLRYLSFLADNDDGFYLMRLVEEISARSVQRSPF
jgi:hypothetical protein